MYQDYGTESHKPKAQLVSPYLRPPVHVDGQVTHFTFCYGICLSLLLWRLIWVDANLSESLNLQGTEAKPG